jgi:serine/threonine protein phosphatase PrpC
MKFEFLEHTDRGLVREVNEDNLGHSLQTKNGDIFVVCDGMGGHVGGKTASTIGVSSIISNLSQQAQGNMHVAISDSLIFANEQVLGHGEADASLKGMGSTATVALLKDDLLYLGHVGDSRAYLFSDGKLYRLTKDDSYVQGLIDNGTITEDEAEVHPNRNRILQALGSKTPVKPRIPNRPFKLKTGDLLMLCSDGLTSMVVDEFIEQLIDPNNLSGTISKLHDMAMTNGGKDNITITLIKITESPFFSSEFDHFTQKYKAPVSSFKSAQFESTMLPPTPIKKNNTTKYIVAAAAFLVLAFGSYKFFWPSSTTPEQTAQSKNNGENKKSNNDAAPEAKYGAENEGGSPKESNDQSNNQKDNGLVQKEVEKNQDPLRDTDYYNDSINAQKELAKIEKDFPRKKDTDEYCNNCKPENVTECNDRYRAAMRDLNKATNDLKRERLKLKSKQ